MSVAGTQMTYADYVTTAPPSDFVTYDAMVRAKDLLDSGLNIPKGALPQLLAMPVNAHKSSTPDRGPFPLVLYFDGLDGDTVSQIVLDEYLASYGYVVATMPIVGPSEGEATQSLSQSDLETTIRDMGFLFSVLRAMPNVDDGKVAVVGHSLGAVEAVLFAMRNANVSAVVGLDGTYGFTPKTLTGFYDYSPVRMEAALLDLRRAQTDTGPSAFVLDLSAVNALHFSARTIVTLKGMYHTDFTMFGILAKTFNFPPFADRNYNIGYAGYQSVCRIVRTFLALHLRGAAGADEQMMRDIAEAPGGEVRHLAAVEIPPTADELIDIAVTRGLTAAQEIVDEYRTVAPGDVVVNESNYNALGYALMAKKQNAAAIAALELDAYAYPHSANIADSLGDMFAGAGQTEKARAAYQHALELLPNDSEQNDAGKNDLRQAILESLKALP
jgi:hypothetical protein